METHYGDNTFGIQAGNIVNSTVNISKVSEQPPDADCLNACLRSLAFNNMRTRNGIRPPVKGSCKWIFKDPKYTSWLTQGGIFWVCGQAGCGKSTLMNSIVGEELKATNNGAILVIPFFFCHGEDELHESTTGFFRSLLHQLMLNDDMVLQEFVNDTRFRERYRTEGTPGEKWTWNEMELRTQSEKVLHSFAAEGVKVRIYLDAIDEHEDDGKDLISFFRTVSVDTECKVSLCFSSRPWISLRNYRAPDISLEEKNHEDVETFLNHRFDSIAENLDTETVTFLKERLLKRTSGIFQWLMWSIDEIEEMVVDGEAASVILDRVKVLPPTLSKIYETALMRISHTDLDLAIEVFQWTALTMRPLPIADLRYAICLASGGSPNEAPVVEQSKHWCDDDNTFTKRLLRLFRGFIRPTLVASIDPAQLSPCGGAFVEAESVAQTRSTVYLDHESVREFFITQGLQSLEHRRSSGKAPVSIARRNFSMAKNCLRYLLTDETMSYANKKLSHFRKELDMEAFDEWDQIELQAPPLVTYASRYWKGHALAAEAGDPSMEELAELVALPQPAPHHGQQMDNFTLIRLAHDNAKYDLAAFSLHLYTSKRLWTELHLLAEAGLFRTMSGLLKDARLIIKGQDIIADSRYTFLCQQIHHTDHHLRFPIEHAAAAGFHRIVELLSQYGADVDFQAEFDGNTPLNHAAKGGHIQVVVFILSRSSKSVNALNMQRETPVILAIANGDIEVVRALLPHYKRSVNARTAYIPGWSDFFGETPLIQAWRLGSPEMLSLVLNHAPSHVMYRDDRGQSLLHYISHPARKYWSGSGHTAKVRLLIDSGKFDLNLRDNKSFTPFMCAVVNSQLEVIELLLNKEGVLLEAVINASSPPHTAFILAVKAGLESVVQFLVDSKKINIFAGGAMGPDALWAAVCCGHVGTLKILLKAGLWFPMRAACGSLGILLGAWVTFREMPTSSRLEVVMILHEYNCAHDRVIYDALKLNAMAQLIQMNMKRPPLFKRKEAWHK